jgi:hypothetical protein
LLSETEGNVFGGFRPVKWESCQGSKGDDRLWSFLFPLRKPDGVPPRTVALMEGKKQHVIYCDSACCAGFGDIHISVSDNCNTNRDNSTHIGTDWSDRADANDTAFKDFLTDAEKFTVKEIEVFEIAD